MSLSQSVQSYSWTQPLCEDCWPDFINEPGREPARVREVPDETCCHCGASTPAGIYVRVDPNGHYCAYPTHVKD
jgi:hypothetical protein